jgi:rod shape-determining protein MreC
LVRATNFDGWPAMDGIGLWVVSGVGNETPVILVTDTSSQVPVTIQPSGQRAILSGDNTINPLLQFIEDPDQCSGDRIVMSGRWRFPAGSVVATGAWHGWRPRARLSADLNASNSTRLAQPTDRAD